MKIKNPKKPSISQWRNNFFTGLAIILPIALSIAVFIWIFGTVAKFTDALLFFIPNTITHSKAGEGPVHWYWSLVAILFAMFLLSMVGRLTRFYIGKKLLWFTEEVLLTIPLLNKLYAMIKQVNSAFASNKTSSFKQVAMVEFPRKGIWSIGFVTGENHPEVSAKSGDTVVSLFVPTTPNPTTGFLCIMNRAEVKILDMSVADGIKYIMSLGAVAPEHPALAGVPPPQVATSDKSDEEDEDSK